jgi:hypothetical protein
VATSLDALVPELQPYARELVAQAGAAGLNPRITSTRRSFWEQTRLFRRRLSGAASYPVALPGTSAHERGEAFDFVLDAFGPDRGSYEAFQETGVGPLWQSWGGIWGAAKDPIHFQLPSSTGEVRVNPYTHTLAQAVDFIIGFNPVIGATELAATLLRIGYPESEVLRFLSGPTEYITG